MPYDGNGNFTLVPSYFVQDGDDVLPVQHNPPLEDIASGFNQVLLRNGAAPLSGNLNTNGNKVINLAAPTNPNDAARLTDLKGRQRFLANKNGSDQSGSGTNKITFANEVFDIGSHYDTATSRWTPEAGAVYIGASASHAIATSGTFTLMIYKNGVPIARSVTQPIASGINLTVTSVFAIAECNGTDYFEVFYTVGSTFSVEGQTDRTWFCGHAI